MHQQAAREGVEEAQLHAAALQRINARMRLLFNELEREGDEENAFDDFWQSFSTILELLVQEKNSDLCRNRAGYPYPLPRDYCYRPDRENGGRLPPHQLWTLTNKFLRNYAVIAAGDSGWRNYSFSGIQCTPTEKEFF
jgi:hypothetical protein